MAEVTPTSGDVVFTPTAILLTGGAGFIGSNAALRILREYPDYKVQGWHNIFVYIMFMCFDDVNYK